MDLDELKELLHILDEREIIEFELEEEGKKLRIRKAAANHAAPPVVIAAPIVPAAVAPPAAGLAAPVPAPASAPPPPPEAAAAEGTLVVKSPIVGTFYRSPDPNSPSFVEVGDRVKPGQVMCIIEAMKLMNEIEAEVAGEVLKVHPQNGQPVQYGDPLFTIRPD
ncbi:MAG TPA: acetyl-CoA carboxylase biotin carboxyl carrier protein [Phenylobacterium sp.]|nr:acetyl-CoA carboxylase biotin carboxyl carrier protein [Phenylobacterium sp.]